MIMQGVLMHLLTEKLLMNRHLLQIPMFVVVAVLALAAAHAPAGAIANADLFATGGSVGGNRIVGDCAQADPDFAATFIPNTNDANNTDYLALVHTDGYGTVVDVDIAGFPVGAAPVAPPPLFDVHAGSNGAFPLIAARPVVSYLYDVGDPGGINENSAAGLAFALAGVLLDMATFDPIAYEPACANFPLVNNPAPPAQPGGSAAGGMTFWNPNDGRLNVEPAAPLAVYCGPNSVYAYAPAGYLALEASRSYIDLVGLPPINTLLAEGPHGERLFRLIGGEFQVNVRNGNQEYVFTWDGCPASYTITRVYDAATWELLVEQVRHP